MVGSFLEIAFSLLRVLPVAIHIFVFLGQILERLENVDKVLPDVLVKLSNETDSLSPGLVGYLQYLLDKCELDVERFAVLEVAVAEMVDQLQEEVFLGLETGGSDIEEEEGEVEVDHVGLLGQVGLDVADPFFQVLDAG